MLPGSARRDPLAVDPGMGSVLAYLRPFSEDSDLLVVGSMTANGIQASSVATAIRRNIAKGDPQELTLVVHQLSLADGAPMAPGSGRDELANAQGVVLGYSQTRRLSARLALTAGMDVNYLNAARDVMTSQPKLRLQYQLDPDTELAVQYGTSRADGSDSLLERVGMLNAFPRITMRGYRLRLERLNHSEVSVDRKLSAISRIELAAFHDALRNAAVWGSGHPEDLRWMAGDFVPNPAVNGVILNAGDYQSSGLRAAYSQKVGNHFEARIAYAFGDALSANGPAGGSSQGDLQGYLRPTRSTSVAGRLSARIPITHTQLVTSYGWVQHGRVTVVDPYGHARLQLQPYLGLQIRQPLPTIAFFPAHIEALADFRNLLAQGYVPLAQSGEAPMLLSSVYRSFRGGFSVQF
jgi:hypothetical protein